MQMVPEVYLPNPTKRERERERERRVARVSATALHCFRLVAA